jgi:alkanesulfonate monooxygenase SsuD/methylene tetrahydromethanopterin reductase-like flavin-dependent oxidoreductase (luciferase family)
MTEEFELPGMPFSERAARTREYVAIMREVWSKGAPRFSGNFVEIHFDLTPKPFHQPCPLILVRGESTSALKRVVEFGDGWHIGLIDLGPIKPEFVQLQQLMAVTGRAFLHLKSPR